jgi:acyl carrier protein
MNVELKVREMLLSVFGKESIEEVPPEATLINDLGADSLDFVEILYLVEKDFNVILTVGEIMTGGSSVNTYDLFSEGKLTDEGLTALTRDFPLNAGRFKTGMTKLELFSLLTVRDLAEIIAEKMNEKGYAC